MARRHVAEGEERVARQEILIAELDHDGHAELAVKARALFTVSQTSLQLLRNDLSRTRASPGDQVSPSEVCPTCARISRSGGSLLYSSAACR